MKRLLFVLSIIPLSLGMNIFVSSSGYADATDAGRTTAGGNTGSDNWIQDTRSKDVSKAYGDGEEDEGEGSSMAGASTSPSHLVVGFNCGNTNEGDAPETAETPFSNDTHAGIVGSVVSQSGDADDSVPKQKKVAL